MYDMTGFDYDITDVANLLRLHNAPWKLLRLPVLWRHQRAAEYQSGKKASFAVTAVTNPAGCCSFMRTCIT